jgi:hypothetical protein
LNVSSVRPSPAETISRLNELAAELSALGWTAEVRSATGKLPWLRARNPEPGALVLSENIYARPDADGNWRYWWPWKQPIAETAAETASVIVRVLRSADTP